MSLSVEGIKPKDEKFNKMLEVYRQCEELSINVPQEVLNFFEHCTYESVVERFSEGIILSLPMGCVREGYAECQDVLIVDLSKLPKDVTQLQVAYSY